MTPSHSAHATESGLVPPIFPRELLESVRAHDRPGEVLEDEDLSISLPRRLGLTGVVDSQIRRYRVAKPWRRSVPVADLLNLIRLVLRRPDAGAILIEAGRRIARARFETAPATLRFMPRFARMASARRTARQLLRTLTSSATVEVRKPFHVRMVVPAIAHLDEIGSGCAVFTGVLDEMLVLWADAREGVSHTACMAHGHDACEWSMRNS
jgi:predicted hydrocarbon binding protein